MHQSEVERKKELLRLLAKELGVRLQGISSEKRGVAFGAQRFKILAETAEKLYVSMHGLTRDQYNKAADDLVDSYWEQSPRTEKSEPGGTRIGYKNIVRCERNAARIYSGLQSRLDHWKAVRDSIVPNEAPADRAQRIAGAERYLQVRDPKKHAGRPSRAFGKIQISGLSGGTNRDAISWEVARLFLEHGDAALEDDVLDAILDNGGSAPSPSGTTLASARFLDLLARCEAMVAADDTSSHERSLLRNALSAMKNGLAVQNRT